MFTLKMTKKRKETNSYSASSFLKFYNRTGNIIARQNWDKAHTLPEALKTGNFKNILII